jgi:competence protein ComEA
MGGGSRRAGFVVVVSVAALGIGVGAGLVGRTRLPPEPVEQPPSTVESRSVEVHVAGWVVAPGVVNVREGALVAEAIEAAGGLRVGARTESLNLAEVVGQGDQIVVDGPDAETPAGNAGGGSLSLNRATATELETLPGVGPVLAERIVAYREEHGRFDEVEDLLGVPGIGETKLSSIRDLVVP